MVLSYNSVGLISHQGSFLTQNLICPGCGDVFTIINDKYYASWKKINESHHHINDHNPTHFIFPKFTINGFVFIAEIETNDILCS